MLSYPAVEIYLFIAAASETISPVNICLQLVEYSRTLREYYRAHGMFSSEVSTLVICLHSIFRVKRTLSGIFFYMHVYNMYVCMYVCYTAEIECMYVCSHS